MIDYIVCSNISAEIIHSGNCYTVHSDTWQEENECVC